MGGPTEEGAVADKKTLRATMRGRLASIPPLQRAEAEDLVNAAVQATSEWTEAGTVLLYREKRPEFSVTALAHAAWRTGKRVAFPRVAAPGVLALHEAAGWEDLAPGAFGIQEPDESAPVVDPADLELAIVPGLAFARGGDRLGQGGGFYDRLLPRLRMPVWGVCFDRQVVDVLPTAPHDRPVDRVWARGLVDLSDGSG